ncbi:unnamed protein product [Caenorhabditis bovis]|uniref:Shugoshin C-terminal domain-containing protein n=1 Tax=Caenorhabditis bovis TaxID=2654633 RepID=A0A8S1EKQ5_9PELO|nr:unnamed protein product [Caenorhabditis bovis]
MDEIERSRQIFNQPVQKKEKISQNDKISYKHQNESLLKKVLQLQALNSKSEKTIERLQKENNELRIQNQKLREGLDEEKIDIIVAQRLKSKLAHISAISQRTIQFLQTAGLSLQEAVKEIEPEPSAPPPTRKKLSAAPNLENLQESPISKRSRETDVDNDENLFARPKKGRRSALIGHIAETPRSSKPAPLRIVPGPVDEQIDNEPQIKDAERPVKFERPSTPIQLNSTLHRPPRSAKLKVSSYKEPQLGGKLRNPGKFVHVTGIDTSCLD